MVSEEPETAIPRRGPSLLFAISVIAGVSLATAGAVAMFFVEPSESAPEERQATATDAVAAEAAAVSAMSALSLPVHKVTTQTVKVPAATQTLPQKSDKGEALAGAAAATSSVEAEPDALRQQDPRWARSNSEKAATVFASVLHNSDSAGKSTMPVTGALALAGEAPSVTADRADGTETAAISPEDLKPKAAAKAKVSKRAANAEVEDDQESPPGVSSATRTVQILKGVNMRSRPKSGSKVLGVVPKGASVQLAGCNVWCEIVYKGRRGYVYRDFVPGGRSSTKASKSKTTFTVSTDKADDAAEDGKQDKTAEATTLIKPLSSRGR